MSACGSEIDSMQHATPDSTRVCSVSPYAGGVRQVQSLFASSPSAGFPAPGDDQVERSLDINDLVVRNPSATFFVRVSGDSMNGAGIFDTDVLVVDRSLPVRNGVIVVAAVFGELVVKRLIISKVGTQLVSEHPEYAPILLSGADDCFVWGVVTGSVRVFHV